MKKLLSVFLLLLICSQICMRIGVYISWKINQDYLTKNECVNRNNPKSCCHAKCQLKKQLSKVDANEQPNDQGKKGPLKVNDQDPFVIEEFVQFNTLVDQSTDIKLYNFVNAHYTFLFLRSSFQPPDAFVLQSLIA